MVGRLHSHTEGGVSRGIKWHDFIAYQHCHTAAVIFILHHKAAWILGLKLG